MAPIWIVRAEVSALLDPIRGGRAFGELDAVLSAENATEAEASVRDMLAAYEMEVHTVSSVLHADSVETQSEELKKLLAELQAGPDQIRLSSLRVRPRK